MDILSNCIAAVMLLFLVGAALYDANGTEVPDLYTVPYCVLGIVASIHNDRIITAIIAFLLLVLMLIPWQPKWLKKLNRWLLSRHYSEEEEKAETEALHQEAMAFEEGRGKTLNKLAVALILLSAVIAVIVLSIKPVGTGFWVDLLGIFCMVVLVLQIAAHIMASQKSDEGKQEVLEASAFGGADALVLIGIFAFYGLIPFLYGVIASFSLYLLWIAAVKIVSKQKAPVGTPMLPALCLTAPVRYVLAVTVCPSMVSTFEWAIHNIL